MPEEQRGSRLERLLAWCVPLLTWTLALWRGASTPQWRADLASLRDHGLAAIGFGGGLSTALTQAFDLVPLGPKAHRASAASAFAVALGAWLLYRIARRLLAQTMRDSPAIASLLAAVAALTASLSPVWQGEATIGGGAAVAFALVAAGAFVIQDLTAAETATLAPGATRRWLELAVLCGAAAAENLLAGLALVVAASLASLTAGRRPAPRALLAMIALAVGCFALLVAPSFLRPLAPRSVADLGRALSEANLPMLSQPLGRREAVLSWVDEVGHVALALAALGFFAGAARERQRPWIAMLVAFPLLDLLLPGTAAPQLVRGLRVAALAIAAGAGVSELLGYLRRLELPMTRAASVLAVVFHMTMAAVVAEEAGFRADRSDHLAAAEWTDAALGSLPEGAAVLVHSPELSWRLWSAQVVEGRRPDVLVISAPLVARGMVMPHIVRIEPEAAPLLRDIALTGKATELGLSLLADARPLVVELDPTWEPRMMTHLALEGPWLRFVPQVIDGSDRPTSTGHPLSVEGRIAASVRAGLHPDLSSAEVIARTLKEHAATLSLLGMADRARPLLDDLERLLPQDPFAPSARLRLDHAIRQRRRGPVELRDLLAF